MQTEDDELAHLLSYARQLPELGQAHLELPAQHGGATRVAELALSYAPLTILAPLHTPGQQPIAAWVVRGWEAKPPRQVAASLEWILLSSVATLSLADAWRLVAWYRRRWLVEDDHKCLKSGCLIEARLMQTRLGLERMRAARPNRGRTATAARVEPQFTQQRAAEHFAAELLTTLAGLRRLEPNGITVLQFWNEVAQLGGYLGRKQDGPPGWQSIWRGWCYLQNVLDGVRLAGRMSQPRCG